MIDEYRQPRRSLQLRFVLLVALLLLGLAAMLGAATVMTQRQTARQAVEDRVVAVGELVAIDASSRADRSDVPSLRLLGEFLRDQPGVIGAYVLEPNGAILAGGVDTVGLDMGAQGQDFTDPAGVVSAATARAQGGGVDAGSPVISEFDGAIHSAQAIVVDREHVRTVTFVTSLDEVGSATRRGVLLVLAVSALFLLIGLTAAAVVMRRVTRRLTRLTIAAEELSEVRLPALVAQMQSDSLESDLGGNPVDIDTDGNDEVARLAQAFAAMQLTTEEVAHTQSELLKRGIGDIFVQLARRNQSLIDRQIEVIDMLEAGERSPDSLAGLFKLDHLAARMRRNAESLLVLAGESQTNVRARPSSLTDVIRVAIGEVEQYHRVEVEAVAPLMVQGSAASGLAHLVAELLDNALRNAPEATRVTVTASQRDDGTCSVEVTDQGVGMTSDQLTEYNALLASPPPMGLSLEKALGFIVVGRLAQQFDAEVVLRPGARGGLVAHVLLPAVLLSEKRELRGRPTSDTPVDPRPSADVVDPRPPSPVAKRSEVAGLGEVAGISAAGLPTRGGSAGATSDSPHDDESDASDSLDEEPTATRSSLSNFDLRSISPSSGLLETLPDPLNDPGTEAAESSDNAPVPLPSRMTSEDLDGLFADEPLATEQTAELPGETDDADRLFDVVTEPEHAADDLFAPADFVPAEFATADFADPGSETDDSLVDADDSLVDADTDTDTDGSLVDADDGPGEAAVEDLAAELFEDAAEVEIESKVSLARRRPAGLSVAAEPAPVELAEVVAAVEAPLPVAEDEPALPALPKRRRGATMNASASADEPAIPAPDRSAVFPASTSDESSSSASDSEPNADSDLKQLAERQPAPRRSPEDLKRMLSSYRRGVERSRQDAPD